MGPFEYLARIMYGWPTKKKPVARIKMRIDKVSAERDFVVLDPHLRQTDPMMFGAISPIATEEDFMSSSQLHAVAQNALKLHSVSN